MFRHPMRVVSRLVLGAAILGVQFPTAINAVDACGTYVDGICAIPPQPVIVDGPTGPVMVDGLEASMRGAVSVAMVNGQRTIGELQPLTESVNASQVVNSITDPPATTESANWDWGGCGGSDVCSYVQIIREYSESWSPQGSFDAYGPAVFNWLEPTQQMDRQYYLWSMHSQVNSNDPNKTSLCILTNSTEIEGDMTPAPQIVDWSPGAPTQVSGGQSVTFNANYVYAGVGIGISSTWNIAQGQLEGKVYQPHGNYPNTGYVGAWEQTRGCQAAVELRNGVIWAQPYRQNDDTTFNLAANVWYASNG